MADIFVSYAREDEHRVAPLVKELERHGWSVFWDRKVPLGKTRQNYTAKALDSARCVLVLWTNSSITQDEVIEEAEDARKRGILLPLLLDAVQPPLGFRRMCTEDLTKREENSADQLCRELLDVISSKISISPDPSPVPQATVRNKTSLLDGLLPPYRTKMQWTVLGVTLILIVLAGVAGYTNGSGWRVPPLFRSLANPSYNQHDAEVGQFRIGEEYGGGIVFYVDETGKHGLIAAKEDMLIPYTDAWQGCVQAVLFRWSTGQSTKENETDYAGGQLGTSTELGQGAANTRKVLQKYPSKTYPYTAAAVASLYRGGEYTDWFLPSKDELNQLYINKSVVGGFSTDSYWSSSELGSELAWYQYFNFGYQSDVGKDGNGRVRPVRFF